MVTSHVLAGAGPLLHSAPAQAHALAGQGYDLAFHTHALAIGAGLGGAGLTSILIHLVIWHLIWSAGLSLWHIPTFGPFIVLLLIAALITLGIIRRRRPRWHGRRWRNRGGFTGKGSGSGPRDW
jgi:hypothetical protein